NPSVLLLDEPSDGLAPAVVSEVADVISRLSDEGMTIILVEQDVQMALSIAEYVAVMEKGQVVRVSSARELRADANASRTHLGLGGGYGIACAMPVTSRREGVMRKPVTIAIAIVVVVSVLGTILLWMMQRHFIYFPDETPVPPAASVIADARDVQLTTSDGLELIGWHVPAITNSRNVTVLVAHGNGGNLAGRASLARALADAGFDVLMFDYRGYGGNPGTPSEEGLARDARAAYAYITDSLDVDPQR